MHISSSYAKILGETNFRTREIPRSGSKAKDGEKREKERLNDGNNNGQLRNTHSKRHLGWRTQSRMGQLFEHMHIRGRLFRQKIMLAKYLCKDKSLTTHSQLYLRDTKYAQKTHNSIRSPAEYKYSSKS